MKIKETSYKIVEEIYKTQRGFEYQIICYGGNGKIDEPKVYNGFSERLGLPRGSSKNLDELKSWLDRRIYE